MLEPSKTILSARVSIISLVDFQKHIPKPHPILTRWIIGFLCKKIPTMDYWLICNIDLIDFYLIWSDPLQYLCSCCCYPRHPRISHFGPLLLDNPLSCKHNIVLLAIHHHLVVSDLMRIWCNNIEWYSLKKRNVEKSKIKIWLSVSQKKILFYSPPQVICLEVNRSI